jgi:hypothetical protein
MLTPNDNETLRWRVIFYTNDDDPPMAIELHTFEEAWGAAQPAPPATGWSVVQKARVTRWFSSGFTRFQPLLVARCDTASTKIQMLY